MLSMDIVRAGFPSIVRNSAVSAFLVLVPQEITMAQMASKNKYVFFIRNVTIVYF
jgi:hypothetical protein